MNVVLLESLAVSHELLNTLFAPLKAQGHTLACYERTADEDTLIREAQDADVLMIANMPLSGRVIRACKHLQFIDVAFTGVDHIAMDACKANGVLVSNCAGCKALSDKNRVVKLELTKTGIYQVIAKSVVVEGRPFVLELISRSDVGIWFDSHGKKMLLEKYGRDFYTDALTGAYCRQYFEDQRASLQGEDGVAMIDVDHFKEINDAYGHPVGDVALKKIVGAILSCIRSTDMLIRYGGDEFLVIFPQIQKDAFTLKMRYIQDVVSRLAVDGYPDIRLSVSIGGVHRVEPLTEAIRQADQLMYRDKANKGVLRL